MNVDTRRCEALDVSEVATPCRHEQLTLWGRIQRSSRCTSTLLGRKQKCNSAKVRDADEQQEYDKRNTTE